MAQIRAAGRAWPGSYQFGTALAPCFGNQVMAKYFVHPGARCHRRHPEAAPVPWLPLVFDAGWFCRQQDSWPDLIDAVFPIRSHAGRLDIAFDRQGFASTQTSSQCNKLLATIKRFQSAGSTFLNRTVMRIANNIIAAKELFCSQYADIYYLSGSKVAPLTRQSNA
jgi:hypothetical protein